jgi:hypothetical protein
MIFLSIMRLLCEQWASLFAVQEGLAGKDDLLQGAAATQCLLLASWLLQ